MKYIWLFIIFSTQAFAGNSTFRDPFTLQLAIDEKQYYEQKFEKIPFMYENTVLLFVNESFGINLKPSEGGKIDVIYEQNIEKADVSLEFTQKKLGENLTMILQIKNNTKKTLVMQGLMTVPGKKGVAKTSIIPINAGLVSFESWPHPIVQLALKDIRLE